ncbi:MAG: peptidase calpain [Thermoleophilia bacterium]|nr:peptidase calpain [Thermoleophilia bacterium]
MTSINTARALAQPRTGTPPPAPAQDDASTTTAPRGTSVGAPLLIGGAALAVAGVVLGVRLLRPVASKVIGTVEGVELLSNPRMSRSTQKVYSWGVPKEGTVFGVAPKPAVSIEHVDQGGLGDCWNVAGMGAIAYREPETITNMVRESGDHVIVALPNRTVALTRELPLRSQDGGPGYAGRLQDDPVLWPSYIEKAQAAVLPNGYRSLEGGFGRTSFEQLLGAAPASRRSTGSVTQDIAAAFRTDRPTVVGVRSNVHEVNLHGSHEYVVTDVAGEGADLKVTLFNPWGEQHPTRALGEADLRGVINEVATPDYFI